jgi:hypothetical protein
LNYLENISLKKLITLIKTEIKTNSGGSADRVIYDNTTSGLAGGNVQEAIDELANASSGGSAIEYAVTISTDWVLEGDLYTQVVPVTGLLPSDDGIVGLILSEDYETSQDELVEWAKIHRIATAGEAITVYATKATTMPLNIQMIITRDGVIETEVVDGGMLLNGSVTPEKLDREYLEANTVLDTNNYSDASITVAKIKENARTQYFDITLTIDGWTGDVAPYVQAVAVEGLLETDRAVVRFSAPDNFADLEAHQAAFSLLYKAESADGAITLYAKEKPETAFSVMLEVARI